MGTFNPNSLTKEQLDKAVRSGKIDGYYFDGDTLIKEISTTGGGYVLKLIVNVDNQKEHAQADYYYDSNGNFIRHEIHK